MTIPVATPDPFTLALQARPGAGLDCTHKSVAMAVVCGDTQLATIDDAASPLLAEAMRAYRDAGFLVALVGHTQAGLARVKDQLGLEADWAETYTEFEMQWLDPENPQLWILAEADMFRDAELDGVFEYARMSEHPIKLIAVPAQAQVWNGAAFQAGPTLQAVHARQEMLRRELEAARLDQDTPQALGLHARPRI